MTTNILPKAILHEHIEGSVTPRVAKLLAKTHNITLPEDFFYSPNSYDEANFPNGRYRYDESDFGAFITTYDKVADLVREPLDYYLVVKDYLSRNAQQGMIYCEIITSAFHLCLENDGQLNAEKYHAIMDKVEQAIKEVHDEFGTVTRLQACAVRHLSADDLAMSMQFMEQNPREIITGFNIAGNEMAGQFADFTNVHKGADRMGLHKSYHAGEICGPESITEALKHGAKRIGHGIRAIDDEFVIAELINNNITLEVSLTSNRILVPQMEQSLVNHPLRKLYDKGVRLSINTDDAGLFGTDVGKEYQVAEIQFGFNRIELLDVTLCALEAAFVEETSKQALVNSVYEQFTSEDCKQLAQYCERLAEGALKSRLTERLQRITKEQQ
ncbi:adenosine deaminase family protein [Vibrio brasiliensis]